MNNLTRLFRSLKHVLIERNLLPLLRCLFDCLIGFVFVQIPLLIDSIINPDEFQKRRSKQQQIRSKLTDESDRKSAYRAIEVLDQLQNQPEEQIETLADIPRVCLSRFADKETMGIRPIINVQQEKQPNGKVFKKFAFGEYQFSSYRQICHRIDLIGRGLLSIGVEPGDRILIFSETRPEWLMTAFAGFTHRFTVVTLIPTLDQQGVLHGIQESNVKLILTSQELFNKLNKIINQIENQIEHIVYFPARADIDSKAKVESEKIEMIPLDKLEQIGKNAQLDENLLKQRPKKEDLAVIMYTSGSTGPPKGTSIRHENIIAAMTGQKQRAYPIIDVEHDVFICYLPLGHIFELCCEILIFYLGVKSGYGTPQTLASESTAVQKGQQGDLQALRPHLMGGVPTIFERMHQAIYGQIKQSNIFLRLIFDFCFAIKRKRMEYGLQTPILDRFLFSRFNKKALGGRLKVILSGGAILSEETQRFAQCALCVQVLQGYGLTETCGGGTIADHQEIDVGRAGYPIVSAEIRLIDWEEGQYRTTDKPNPRGEILIGGKIVADSYFGDAQEENDNFKEIEGIKYFYTGDIGQIFPDGTIQIIGKIYFF